MADMCQGRKTMNIFKARDGNSTTSLGSCSIAHNEKVFPRMKWEFPQFQLVSATSHSCTQVHTSLPPFSLFPSIKLLVTAAGSPPPTSFLLDFTSQHRTNPHFTASPCTVLLQAVAGVSQRGTPGSESCSHKEHWKRAFQMSLADTMNSLISLSDIACSKHISDGQTTQDNTLLDTHTSADIFRNASPKLCHGVY